MRKLILLHPPSDADAHDVELARCQLDELERAGVDLASVLLNPGWHREVFEGDEVFVRLKDPS